MAEITTGISQCESVEVTYTMSKFRKFGLPRLLEGKSPGIPKPKDDGTPRFDCNQLAIKDRIGHGAFNDVFTADYQVPGKDSSETVVIKKMINAMDAEERKLFLEEVALLSGLNHRNVVKFMSACHQPPADRFW